MRPPDPPGMAQRLLGARGRALILVGVRGRGVPCVFFLGLPGGGGRSPLPSQLSCLGPCGAGRAQIRENTGSCCRGGHGGLQAGGGDRYCAGTPLGTFQQGPAPSASCLWDRGTWRWITHRSDWKRACGVGTALPSSCAGASGCVPEAPWAAGAGAGHSPSGCTRKEVKTKKTSKTN